MTTRRPPGRYGERRAPRGFYAVGGALLATLIVIVVLVARQLSTPDVGYGVRAFTTAERSVSITFDVRKAPSAAATCLLRARSRDGAEVGSREVVVGPRSDGAEVTIRTERLSTSARPVTGEVKTCRVSG